MRRLKKILRGFVLFLLGLIVFLYLFDYDYLIRAVRTVYLNGHTTAYLDDYNTFDNRVIPKGDHPVQWLVHQEYNKAQAQPSLTALHEKYSTVAFLIIKNDSLWHEQYYDGYDKDSKSNSFSMAKSIVTAILGKAIMQGKIKSLDQPVGEFFPEYSKGMAAKLTVGDLASMASGLEWDEVYYSPFSIVTRAYFDENLREVMLNLEITSEPGKSFTYLSGNTQLLAMVIEKATGKHLSEYFSEEFWQPLGAENQALWQIDSEDSGLEKAYCCIASNARDFARFGKLYKDGGVWQGKQLLDKEYVEKSIRPRFKDDWMYGYGFWLLPYQGKNFFMMRGHLGQYVIVEPEDNVIIVRLGHQKGKKKVKGGPYTADIYGYIEEAYKMLESGK